MNLDEVDKFIIVSILDANKKKKLISSWEMAKKYPWSQEEKGLFITESDETAFYTDRNNFIDYRLKKLEKNGLIQIIKNGEGKRTYAVINTRIKKITHIFKNKSAMALLLTDNKGKFIIQEI